VRRHGAYIALELADIDDAKRQGQSNLPKLNVPLRWKSTAPIDAR